MPRSDHSAQLIKNDRWMLVYGGRNDLAYSEERDGLKPMVSLDDVVLFDLEKGEWRAVC